MPKRCYTNGGFEGRKILIKCKSNAKKPLQAELKDAQSSFPGSLDDMYEKHARSTFFEEEKEVGLDQKDDEFDEEAEEQDMGVHSAYDNLLKKLGTTSKSLMDWPQKRELSRILMCRKRKEKNGHDFDDKGDYQPTCDNLGGFKGPKTLTKCRSNESKRLRAQREDAESSSHGSLGIDGEGVDDDDISENGGRVGGSSSRQCQSAFDSHMEHKLSEQDTENLLKRKWMYTWHMPASGSTNCRWMGTGDSFLKDVAATAPYGLTGNLYKQWLEVFDTYRGGNFHSSQQRLFFSLCNSYRDILYSNQEAFYHKGSDKVASTMDAYIMHSLNHVFKSRDLVMKNNAKSAKIDALSNDGFADQGFTRAKVLILLPLASVALCLVRRLIQLTPSSNKVNVEYMDRFIKEFGVDIEQVEDELEAKRLKEKALKHPDYKAIFGGKVYDNFVVGVKFTRKSIRLYSDFHSSDMIIASPLGLIRQFAEAKVCKEKDVDYLSSIEILIVDHADIMLMQNWNHVVTVVERLNILPSKPIKTDIGRIRHWSWNARFYRQTIILASYLNPDINALFNQHCLNFEGKLRLSCEYEGVMSKILSHVNQVYERFHLDSICDADDARLDYFVKKLLPRIKTDSFQGGIMLFISSYLEFIRIRNLLKAQNVSFCLLSEDTTQYRDISRARNWFMQGCRKVMLFTERAQFYRRYKIRGIRNLIVYSLPETAEIYTEILNMIEGSQTTTCIVLFSRFDKLRLERIVGSATAKRMTSSEKDLFIFK